jgi:hypothetical protein
MYLLQFLETAPSRATAAAPEAVDIEYRLACSGELFNRKIITGDWRKSDITRVLLRTPLELFVNSQPFDAYPQELCARMTLSYVTEVATGDISARTIRLPDEDVIEDLCSILSLLSRRLISPVAKTHERRSSQHHGPHAEPYGSYTLDFPVPIIPLPRFAAWNRRPLTVITSLEGQRVVDNSPPP